MAESTDAVVATGSASPDFSSARVLVAGDLMLDRYWFGEVSRISPEAPVPVVRVTRSEERLGGAANVAFNAVVLGARATLVGVIGDDEPGARIEALAGDCGIELHAARDAQVPTTIKLRVIGRNQQLLRVDFEQSPGEPMLARTAQAVRDALPSCGVLVLSDYGKGALARIDALIAMAREANRTVIVDPKGDDYGPYAGATILTPNRAELREVVGSWRDEADLRARAQALRESLDVRYLLLTRSEEGMTLFSSNGVIDVAAQAREVYDVSGAGDTVVAVLASMIAAGRPVDEAVRLANRAAGIVVGKLGTAAATPQELFG
ncbi:MAG: D-glycero-beta-D-manno-heptose-7-phosphate kinase [Burkholderiaceae bacterium]|nr:D-glycero-beta-D-manno-heptose-7-phosphate kinase [Burkholderiaceae bacterium]